ncbi:hypothetical protein [Leclercia adecarboxylata]|uniref:hypothetical protein n=1 Tax=Leclercia adecarboxylata TaxID=83655 RepID=UPI0021F0CD5D|nr:hypothetical protein [Leclercia adecarboxylata]UYM57714.1 hypothetical protein N5937_10780 [Leclercia adecarboxylata]
MSSRQDIRDGADFEHSLRGLIYTDVLGWIDMGHARGDDVEELRRQFVQGEGSGRNYYVVMYRQDMSVAKFSSRLGIGRFAKWEIRRGRDTHEINRMMLAMMMSTAFNFEDLQSLRLFTWYTDSGFSGEDLVSDLFGFYRAIRPGFYADLVKPVSYESALRRWDYYGAIGSFKNRGFKPIIFPDPDDPCIKHEPYIAELPMFMRWIYPWDDFTSGIVNVLTENGTAFGYTGVR